MTENEQFCLDFPLDRTHCGFPLGNGTMGALVWGKDKLYITVNRADFWDHRNGEKIEEGSSYESMKKAFAEDRPLKDCFVPSKPIAESQYSKYMRPHRLPAGRFEMALKEIFVLSRGIIDYDSGCLTIELKNKSGEAARIVITMDIDKSILLLEDASCVIDAVDFTNAWNWELNRNAFTAQGCSEPRDLKREKMSGCFIELPEDPGLAAVCKSLDNNVYAVSLELGDDQSQAIDKAVAAIDACDVAASIARSRKWWNEYWKNCSQLNIPDNFFNAFAKFAQYKFACATHPNGVLPPGLQGVWTEEYQPAPWCCDYHFNVNIQQIYSPAFASGKFEHLLPLFDMLESESFQSVMRGNAHALFGIDDGLFLTHAVDDRGYQVGGIGTGACLDHACGGWVAQLYWQYYLYTLDKEFLEKRAYPFIYGIMRSYEEMIEEHEGRLSIPVSISAEYGAVFRSKDGSLVRNYGRDPSYQLACCHMLIDFLFEACDTLGIAPRECWMDIKKRLPEYTLTKYYEYRKEGSHIAIWEDQDLDICHRHHSHLACIYPFDSLREITDEKREILEDSVDHWILRGMGAWSEWCYPWAVIIQNRMGYKQSPAILFDLWRQIFINEAWATAYLPRFGGITSHRRVDMRKPKETHEVMQLDGSMIALTALHELLVYPKRDEIMIFAATPDQWPDASFANVKLPRKFVISGERKATKAERIEIRSLAGGKIKVNIPDWAQMNVKVSGRSTVQPGRSTIELAAGETAVLTEA